jgi:LCP family protein required for cell wall assembly
LRSHRVARTVGLVVLATVVFGTAAAGFTVLRLRGNVTTLDSVAGLVAPPTSAGEGAAETPTPDDPMEGRAVNILVLATDDRSGENAALAGADPGGGSDTTLIVHLAADRSRADIVSIPRDSRAQIPACHLDRDPAGAMSRAQEGKFNKAFAIGWATGDPALAAACTISTVQTMTGLTIDGFVILDMAGFVDMVDAVGGVRVCVPEPLDDEGNYTNLHLTAGWHDLVGAEALDYVRARHVSGSDGTDPSRIERQQRFIGALMRKVLSSDVLRSPVELGRFLDAATSSLTVSSELGSTTTQLGLAWGLRDLTSQNITFLTTPWEYGTSGYVDWTDDAALVWSRLLADQPLNSAAAPAGGTADPTAGAGGTPGEGTTTPTTPDLPIRTADDPDEVICGP